MITKQYKLLFLAMLSMSVSLLAFYGIAKLAFYE